MEQQLGLPPPDAPTLSAASSRSAQEAAFFELKENAAPGVDGLTWRAYEEGLDAKILDLHSRLHKRWTVGNAPIASVVIDPSCAKKWARHSFT